MLLIYLSYFKNSLNKIKLFLLIINFPTVEQAIRKLLVTGCAAQADFTTKILVPVI